MKTLMKPGKRLLPCLGALALIAMAVKAMLPLRADTLNSTDSNAALLHQGSQIVVPAASPLRRSLAMAQTAEQDIAVPFNLPASVEPDPARLAKILPPVSGRIVAIHKRLGDTVKAGDVLFELESADLAQAYSDERKAQATLALTRRALERQRALDQAEIASRRDLEQAQSDFAQADSEAARAHARLAQLGAGAASSGGRLAVRAPLSGQVIELNAAVGTYWNDTTAAVMTVADLSALFVTANAQEKDLARLYPGQSADIVLDAFPDAPLQARVRTIGPLLDADTRTLKIRMQVANDDGRLRPGMFAQATLRDKPHRGVLIPMSAVVQSGFNNRVFVETAPWSFAPKAVTLGAQIGEQVEVLSGVAPGARVVTRDGVLLND